MENIFPLVKECLEHELKVTITMRFDQDFCDEDKMHMWDLFISNGWKTVCYEEMPTIEKIIEDFGY